MFALVDCKGPPITLLTVFQLTICAWALLYPSVLAGQSEHSQCSRNPVTDQWECFPTALTYWLGLAAQLVILPMYAAAVRPAPWSRRRASVHFVLAIAQGLWWLALLQVELMSLIYGFQPQWVSAAATTLATALIVVSALAQVTHLLHLIQHMDDCPHQQPNSGYAALPIASA